MVYRPWPACTTKETTDQQLMLLNEIFSSPAPVKQTANNFYQFQIGDKNYTVEFNTNDLPPELTGEEQVVPAADVQFYTLNKHGHRQHLLTGAGNPLKVFSTVLAVISKWISDNQQIKYIHFSADKSEQSRVKLYNRMINQFNINYRTSDQHDDLVYIIPTEQFR